MLRLRLPKALLKRMELALRNAGSNEIGGVLVGEHVGENCFHLSDLSIQATPGEHACFVRMPAEHSDFMEAFHDRTGHDYTRFNYLGEWHSHPSFPVSPSTQDAMTMQAIVDDHHEPAQFAVLLIARLDYRHLNLGALAFREGLPPMHVELEIEKEIEKETVRPFRSVWSAISAPFRRRRTEVLQQGESHE